MNIVHPLHSICPYFAMFPPEFVKSCVLAFTEPGDIVFDPFAGRGTTIFESLLLGRPAFGIDINPVAACVSGAKAAPPKPYNVRKRLYKLRNMFQEQRIIDVPDEPFFSHCYSPTTLRQICFLRSQLNWKERKVDRFIAAMVLGCLHGESHKSANCFSNRMPRTISTKPNYSIGWWKRHGYFAPERDVFEILLSQIAFRYSDMIPTILGRAKLGDARKAGKMYKSLRGQVRLLLTSPPYLDTTDYGEDQWLRLWFLGGEPRPKSGLFPDSRHSSSCRYWSFLRDTWQGQATLLSDKATIIIRIGGRRLKIDEIQEQVQSGITQALENSSVELIEAPRTSEIRNRQTNVFRPGTEGKRLEHDFIFRTYCK